MRRLRLEPGRADMKLENGFISAPVEPTKEMVEAGELAIDEYYTGSKDADFAGSIVACYKAMLAELGRP